MKVIDSTQTFVGLNSPGYADRMNLRNGNTQALRKFFDTHSKSIHRRILAQVRNQLDAEDLTQDVLLRIQKFLPKLDPTKAIEPWISAILRNRIIDHWRTRGNRRDSFSYDAEEQPSFFPESRVAQPYGAQEQLESEHIVRSAIDGLPPRQHAVLTLRFYEGYSFEEIAAQLDLAPATARKRYSRALEALRSSPALVDLHLSESISPALN
jgi:RNA polymerase sigma-70 factor (ECF subfamily)